MKTCFMFTSRDDAKEVENMLASHFDVKHNNYIGYDILYVPKKHYREAISMGINFIRITHIKTAWWVNEDNVRMPIDIVPLLFAEIPESFKNNKFLKKVATILCRRYTKSFEKRLNQKISVHYTPCNNVEFYLTRCYETTKNHEYYMKKITRYCLARNYIFNYIVVCNAYGKTITIINKNHSVEYPTKTPH